MRSNAAGCRTQQQESHLRGKLFRSIAHGLNNETHEHGRSKTYSLVNIQDKQIVTRENSHCQALWETRTGNSQRKLSVRNNIFFAFHALLCRTNMNNLTWLAFKVCSCETPGFLKQHAVTDRWVKPIYSYYWLDLYLLWHGKSKCKYRIYIMSYLLQICLWQPKFDILWFMLHMASCQVY